MPVLNHSARRAILPIRISFASPLRMVDSDDRGGTTKLAMIHGAVKIPLQQRKFQPVSSACHVPVLVTKKGRKQSRVHRRGTGSREKEIGRGKTDRGLAFTASLRGRFALRGVETGN